MFSQDWNIKPRKGRQRKVWSRIINDLFVSLELDKDEWLKDIVDGSRSLKALAGESISEWESKRFEEGLNTKVKLTLYKTFGKAIEFKKYLHGAADAGSRLLFKFRSGTHGLYEELGRHRGRDGNKGCVFCGNECESVSHVLWECSAYSNSRADFLLKLQEKLGNGFERFDAPRKIVFYLRQRVVGRAF